MYDVRKLPLQHRRTFSLLSVTAMDYPAGVYVIRCQMGSDSSLAVLKDICQ